MNIMKINSQIVALSSPGRVCHNATDRVLEVAEEGYIYVIDMEQGKFIA